MKEKKRILYLLDHYVNGECSEDEKEELFEYINSGRYDHIMSDHILKSLHNTTLAGEGLDAEKSEEIMEKILWETRNRKPLLRSIVGEKPIRRIVSLVAIAAVLLIAVVLISPDYLTGNRKVQVIASLQENSKYVVNKTKQGMSITLQDGSKVILQPGATLTYPEVFSGAKREVQLDGDAFFDIAKNPDQPFLVYHGNLVTKVLGTSFNIRNKNNDHEAEVEVLRGKVEVYENTDFANDRKAKNNGVIITPNQKVIYVEEKNLFSTTLVDKPIPVVADNGSFDLSSSEIRRRDFRFDKTSMAEIVECLHNIYGIEIDMENKEIANCQFSGDISEYDLFSKLDMLCQAIGIEYSIKGTRILLAGKGCKH